MSTEANARSRSIQSIFKVSARFTRPGLFFVFTWRYLPAFHPFPADRPSRLS
jgi:hypothetical protein